MRTSLDTMIATVVNAFAGKYDKGGQPYVLHCFAVMHKLRTTDEELQCIALGHDLFEDTDVTAQGLCQLGFSVRVIDGIYALTKMPGESYDECKAKVKKNPDAIKVKKCDLMHNSDLRRLKGITPKDLARVGRYMEFYQELNNV